MRQQPNASRRGEHRKGGVVRQPVVEDHSRQRDVGIGLQLRQPRRFLDKARYRIRRLEHQ